MGTMGNTAAGRAGSGSGMSGASGAGGVRAAIGARGEPAMQMEALEVPLGQIAPDPQQPRRRIEAADVAELAESVRAQGVVQPLLVRPHPARVKDGPRFMLITGERRWAAARAAGRATVPVVVRRDKLGPADILMMQLDENDGALRRELSLAERAAAVVRAYELSGLRKEEFATRHKKSAGWLSHYLTIAKAKGVMREALDEGRLGGIRAAVAYAKLPAAEQTRLLAAARRSDLPLSADAVEEALGRGAGNGAARAGGGTAGEGNGREGEGAAAGPAAAGATGTGGGAAGELAAAETAEATAAIGRAGGAPSADAAGETGAAAAARAAGVAGALATAGEGAASGGSAAAGAAGEAEPAALPGGAERAGAAGTARAAASAAAATANGGGRLAAGAGPWGGLGERPSSAAGNFLAAGAAIARERDGEEQARHAKISVDFTPRQLEMLLLKLGERPRRTAALQVQQLLLCLE
ncbi:MAG TPA: ParB/RepB/Spo0J family partition protein [Thermoanaerobaculia bacterium]|nr:ParB/RepB/Spo0J family partition protein [Thermoanaerobaculia bacterium]